MIKIYNADDYTMSNLQIVIKPTKAEVYKNDEGEYYADVTIPITQNIAGRAINLSDYFVQDNIIVVDTPDGEQAFRVNNPIKTTRSISTKANHVFLDTKKYLITSEHFLEGYLKDVLDSIYSIAGLPQYFTHSYAESETPFITAFVGSEGRITAYDAIMSAIKNIQIDIRKIIRFYDFEIIIYPIYEEATISDIIIENAKNLTSIQVTENWDEVCTRCLALGYNDLRATYATPSNPYPYHYGKVVQFQPPANVDTTIDAEIIADLQTQAENYVNEHLYPLINYQVTANIDTKIDIGDPIKVKHNQLGVDILTEIISFKWNALTKRYTQIEYGNYKPNVKGYANKTNDRIKRLEMRIGQGGL